MGNWFRHMGTIAPVPEPARDRVQLSQADNHLSRHLALYTSEELNRFRELQLLPAVKATVRARPEHQLWMEEVCTPSAGSRPKQRRPWSKPSPSWCGSGRHGSLQLMLHSLVDSSPSPSPSVRQPSYCSSLPAARWDCGGPADGGEG